MKSLFLRNLFFTILQPGAVAGLLPFIILKMEGRTFFSEFGLYQFFGLLIFLVGFGVMLNCIYRFATEGKGTLSPADQTQELVIKGLYQYSRNPMYVGVLLILIGEGIFFTSLALISYALVTYAGFDLFIKLIEEPRLKKDFGEGYEAYCEKVRRWI